MNMGMMWHGSHGWWLYRNRGGAVGLRRTEVAEVKSPLVALLFEVRSKTILTQTYLLTNTPVGPRVMLCVVQDAEASIGSVLSMHHLSFHPETDHDGPVAAQNNTAYT